MTHGYVGILVWLCRFINFCLIAVLVMKIVHAVWLDGVLIGGVGMIGGVCFLLPGGLL